MPKTLPSESNLPAQGLQQSRSHAALLSRQEFYSSPLPPPADLKAYGEVDPGYPERVMRMAEAHSAVNVQKKAQEASSIPRGQVFSFILGMSGFVFGAVFALLGIETGAIAAIAGGVIPIIVAALANLKK